VAAAFSAALRRQRIWAPEAFIVAFFAGPGMRYLSKVYKDEWMSERG